MGLCWPFLPIYYHGSLTTDPQAQSAVLEAIMLESIFESRNVDRPEDQQLHLHSQLSLYFILILPWGFSCSSGWHFLLMPWSLDKVKERFMLGDHCLRNAVTDALSGAPRRWRHYFCPSVDYQRLSDRELQSCNRKLQASLSVAGSYRKTLRQCGKWILKVLNLKHFLYKWFLQTVSEVHTRLQLILWVLDLTALQQERNTFIRRATEQSY